MNSFNHYAYGAIGETYESVYGKIESERRDEGDYVAWRAVIPPHTYAAESPPNGASLMVQDEESGEWAVAEGEGRFESGEYAFRIALA